MLQFNAFYLLAISIILAFTPDGDKSFRYFALGLIVLGFTEVIHAINKIAEKKEN